MLNAFLVALAVFICVGGAELVGFTMLNRPIVIGPLVGLFLGDLHTGVIIGASVVGGFLGVVLFGGACAAEPGMEDYKGKSPLELTKKELADYVKKLEKEMKQAAGDLQFERAAQLRDQIFEYKVRL